MAGQLTGWLVCEAGQLGVAVLTVGQRITLPRSGVTCTVGQHLGSGGQGAVFVLIPDDAAAQRAGLVIKWYNAVSTDARQRENLLALCQRSAPGPGFLWPRELVDGQNGEFGYVMPRRPDAYRPVADLLTGRVDVPFSVVIRLCLQLAQAFLALHIQGLCYRDISHGNVFFEPSTGAALICDNDNVGVQGMAVSQVLGTVKFMAPEVLRGEADPSIETDLHSLAVLIFYLLMLHHPLQGRRELAFACLDREAETELYGRRPLFCFDPLDDANAPDPVEHAAVLTYWPLYPSWIRAAFTRAFTLGLSTPSARVRDGVWRRLLARLLDCIVVCPCGRENLGDGDGPGGCWACRQPIPAPVRLEFGPSGDRPVTLNPTSTLTRHHLVRDYDYQTTVAEVVRHPDGRWGLLNRQDVAWQATLPSGEGLVVPPGRAIGLIEGAWIDFGPARARIRR